MLLEEVLLRHPKLRLYIMHGGVPITKTIAIMSMYPQVYADLAMINWIPPRQGVPRLSPPPGASRLGQAAHVWIRPNDMARGDWDGDREHRIGQF